MGESGNRKLTFLGLIYKQGVASFLSLIFTKICPVNGSLMVLTTIISKFVHLTRSNYYKIFSHKMIINNINHFARYGSLKYLSTHVSVGGVLR